MISGVGFRACIGYEVQNVVSNNNESQGRWRDNSDNTNSTTTDNTTLWSHYECLWDSAG